MAAPDVNFNSELILGTVASGVPQPPVYSGAATPANLDAGVGNANGGTGADSGAGMPAPFHIGYALPFPAVQDLTGWRYLTFAYFTTLYATSLFFDTLANGGLSVLLHDTGGNWSEFHIYGGDFVTQNASEYGHSSYKSLNATNGIWTTLDLSRSPDRSGGALDLSAVAGLEFSERRPALPAAPANRARFQAVISNIWKHNAAVGLAGAAATPLTVASFATSSGPGGARYMRALTDDYTPANGDNRVAYLPFNVGDGVTPTWFVDRRINITVGMSIEAMQQTGTPELWPCYLGQTAVPRVFCLDQSAACSFELSDSVWSGLATDPGEYSLRVQGDPAGVAVFTNVTLARAAQVVCGHASWTACIFDACREVRVGPASRLTDVQIRNAPTGAQALVVEGPAGDYSAVQARIDSPAALHDVVVGASGAGTYDLTGLSVPEGYTLRVHGVAAGPVTVLLAAGITAIGTTEAGTLDIQAPPVTFTLRFPAWLDGTRHQLFNVTQDRELRNDVVAGGAGLNAVLTLGADYAAGDLIRLRGTWCGGAAAMQPVEQVFQPGAASTETVVPAAQIADSVYAALGIDGTAVTRFVADYVNTEIEIVVAGNFALDEMYAWYCASQTSADGIRIFFGAVRAIDQANFEIDVAKADARLDNATAANVWQTDVRRLSRSDGQRPVRHPTTGGGGIDLRWQGDVLIAETGVSGLTGPEAALLADIAAVKERTDRIPDTPAEAAQVAAIRERTDRLPDDPASEATILRGVEDAALL